MGPSQPSTVTQTNQVKLGPQQQKVFDLALPSIESYAASTPQLFPGSAVAGFDPMQLQAQQSALTAANSPLVGAGAGAQAQMLDPDFMLKPNQYVHNAANAVTSQVTQNLMENILPGIRSNAIAEGGPYSGGATREGITAGKAISGTNQGLSNALADMYFKNYSTGLAGMSEAIGRNPQVLQAGLFPAQVQGAVGTQNQNMQQALLNEAVGKFYGTQNLDYNKAASLLGMIGMMPGATGTSTVTGAQPQANPLMQGLGLGMTALSLLGGGPLGLMGGMGGMGMGMGK